MYAHTYERTHTYVHAYMHAYVLACMHILKVGSLVFRDINVVLRLRLLYTRLGAAVAAARERIALSRRVDARWA